MTSWQAVTEAEPEFARVVQQLFDAHKHKTIATLRADGSPRISGIEAEFVGAELQFGSMPGSRKGADLHRDPRFALHSASVDPPAGDPSSWAGEAKISGRARSAGALPGSMPGELFHADIDEVARTTVTGNLLVIELWRPGHGLHRFKRT